MEGPSRWRSVWRLEKGIVRHKTQRTVALRLHRLVEIKLGVVIIFNLPNIYELTKSTSHVSKHFHDNASYVPALGHKRIAATSPRNADAGHVKQLGVFTPVFTVMHLLVITDTFYARPGVHFNFCPLSICRYCDNAY